MATASRTGETSITTPSDTEVVVKRTFNAPRELLFDVWSKTEHLPNWMLGPEGWTMPVCEADVRPGGDWHYVWRRTDGTEMGMHGKYLEVERPERLVTTEAWGGDWPETVNTLVFTEEAGVTMMTLTITYPSKAARDAAIGTGMNDGMNVSLDRLETYLRILVQRRS